MSGSRTISVPDRTRRLNGPPGLCYPNPFAKLRGGAVTDLSITVNGMKFDNPFVLGSGPPGTNGKVIARSYDLGWGGMVCKTFSLDASKVINTAPRYAKLRGRTSEEVN